MKKKLFLALLIAAAAIGGVLKTANVAHAAEPGDSCTTEGHRSGYMLATGVAGELVCVASDGQ